MPIIWLVLGFASCFSQTRQNAIDAKIVELQNSAPHSASQSIASHFAIYDDASELGYRKGMIQAQQAIAESYLQLNIPEDALRHAKIAEELSAKSNETFLLSESLRIQLLANVAIVPTADISLEIPRITSEIKKISSEDEQNKAFGSLYLSVATLHFQRGENAEATNYIQQSISSFKSVISEETKIGDAYLLKAHCLLAEKIYDEAIVVLSEAKALKTFTGSQNLEFLLLMSQIHEGKGELQTAVDLSEQGIAEAKLFKQAELLRKLYFHAAHLYKKLNKPVEAQNRLTKHSRLLDSLEVVKAVSMRNVLKIKTERMAVEGQPNNSLYLRIFGFVGLLILLATAFIYLMTKRLKRDSQKNNYNELRLLETENQVKNLNLQVNHSAEKLVKFARTDDPTCIAAAKELYPNFFSRLLEIEPNLSESEQKFCMYLKLQFSTKEIADFYASTPKAIQNKKTRIRKRLHLPAQENLYEWMANIV